MKANKTLLFCLGLALLSAGATAGVQDDFSLANRLYEEGKFTAALPLYLQVSERVTDWKVLYDIGNCHYKLEQFLEAKIYYLKARKLRPLDDAITRNIAMTNRHFRDLAALPESDFVSRSLQVLESKLSLDGLSILLLAAVLLLNICLFLLQTRGKDKRVLYAAALFFSLALVFAAYHISRVNAMGRGDSAVIRQADSLLRSGPGEDNTVLFKVNPGLEVKIVDRFRDWVQVAASAQVAGWIEKERLALI